MRTPTLLQAVQQWAIAQPDHVAIEECADMPSPSASRQVLSYSELWELAQVYHHSIAERTNHKNHRIAILLPRGADFIAALLGAWLSKCSPILLDPEWPPSRIQTILDEAQPDLIIDKKRSTSTQKTSIFTLPLVDPDSVAYIIYSSGSSGRPKGILVPHAGLHDMLSDQIAAFELSSNSRTFWIHGIAFDASISDIGTTLMAGATLCLDTHFKLHSAHAFFNQLRSLHITHIDIPPSLLSVLDVNDCPPTLKTLIVGGEVTPSKTIQSWAKKKRVINVYGPSEATVCTSMIHCFADWCRPLIGTPMTNVHYRIYHPDDHQQEVGRGELHITSPGVALGYLNQPQLTQSRFYQNDHQRTFRTGDLVHRLPDGTIEFLGRCDRQVKIHGQLLCPEEVESALLHHSSVLQIHVAYMENQLMAWVQLKPGYQPENFSTYLKSYLPQWMIPTQWNSIEQLPRLSNGKIDVQALYKQQKENSQKIPLTEKANHTLEERITAIMCDTLSNPNLSSSDDFFSAGGDSLSSIIFLVKAKTAGIQLPPNCLNQFKTAQGIAQHLILESNYVLPRSQLMSRVEQAQSILLANLKKKKTRSTSETACRKRCILLTGATGFLGCHVLGSLLEKTHDTILCVVRGNKTDQETLIFNKLQKHGFALTQKQSQRIQLISADIEHENLGLKNNEWAELSERVESIIHCAADLNLLKSLDDIENTNVHGTRRLLELVHSGAKKRFIYASTLSVFVDASPAPSICKESDTLEHPDLQVFGGYAQSKWMAEKIIHHYPQSKSVTSIVRLGLLTPQSSTGYSAKNDTFLLLLQSLQSGQTHPEPDDDASMDFTPVDYAAAAIVEISLHGESNKTYHIANPTSLKYTTIKKALSKLTTPFPSRTPSQAACSQLVLSASTNTSNQNNSLNLFKTTHLKFCTKNTRALLADTGLICPTPTPDYLANYLSTIFNHLSS